MRGAIVMPFKNISLTSLYKHYIHVPNIKGTKSNPLYAINDDKVTSDEISGIDRSPEWISASKNSYNSPTNVRRLIITKEHVRIDFYRPIIVNGKQSTEGLTRTRAVNSVLSEMITERTNLLLGKAAPPASKENDPMRYNITGSVLSLIRTPWVLSNIEEIYMDTTCLYTDKLRARIGDLTLAKMEAAKSVSPLKNSAETLVKTLLGVPDLNDAIDKQFQRLKIIGIIPNLEDFMQIKVIKDGMFNSDTFLSVIKDSPTFNKQNYILYKTKNAGKPEDGKLAIRSYYVFDANYLQPYTNKWQNELKVALDKAAATRAEAEIKRIEESKTEVEKQLDLIENTKSLDDARTILRIAVSWLSPGEKKEILDSLTESCKSKYSIVLC